MATSQDSLCAWGNRLGPFGPLLETSPALTGRAVQPKSPDLPAMEASVFLSKLQWRTKTGSDSDFFRLWPMGVGKSGEVRRTYQVSAVAHC